MPAHKRRAFWLGQREEVRRFQRHFTRQQHGGHVAFQFVSQILLSRITSTCHFPFAPLQGGAQLTHHALRAADGKVHIHRNGRGSMREHDFAFVRLGIQQVLVKDEGCILLRAKQDGSLTEAAGNMRRPRRLLPEGPERILGLWRRA